MVKPARDGSGFDAARDARPLAGESRAQFDAFLAIWAKIELEDLPGFFYWQRSAFDMLHDHLRYLGGIFFEYCKRGAAGAKSIAEAFTMSSREWAAFCKECKVPVPISELNDTFRRVDRAEKGAKAGTKSDKQLVLGEFIEAIVRLAVKMMLMSAAGRKAVKEGKSAEGLRRLLDSYVLKHAARDSMAQLRLAITDEPTVKAVLDAARVPLTKRFAAAAKRKTEDGMSPGPRGELSLQKGKGGGRASRAAGGSPAGRRVSMDGSPLPAVTARAITVDALVADIAASKLLGA